MSAMEAAEFVARVSLKKLRVKKYRGYMRRSALLWRHACRFQQWETATLALATALQYRELAKVAGGAL